jgi:hypothetical protein
LRGKIVITLDFDGRDVRLLVAKGDRALSWATLTVPGDLMHQGLISDPQDMAKRLRKFLSTQHPGKGRVVTSVTGYRSVTRLFQLPVVQTKLLEQTIYRKAKQEMPLPIEETYLSWQIIGRANNHMQIFTLAVPKIVIDRQMETLKLANLHPAIMDLRPLSLSRGVYQENAVIVNLEEQNLGVIVVEKGIPLIIRTVPKPEGPESLKETANRLNRELSRTIQFYGDNYLEAPLSSKTVIYATGAAFDNPKMAKQISQSIPYPLARPRPPLKHPPDFPLSTYCVNLGLAMKEA